MIKKLSFAILAGSLLLGTSSCKKDNILPRNSSLMENGSAETGSEAKNNGKPIFFTRCPNVDKQNLGCNIWFAGKANSNVAAIQIFLLDWTSGPTPLFDGTLLEDFTYSEDGKMQYFQTPENFIMFEQSEGSPVGHTYTFLSEALDINGGIIETMECTVTVTDPFQNGIKGTKVKVIENNNGTADLNAIVNPRSYINQGWVSTDQLTLGYEQLPPNSLLIPGASYTLEYAGMKDNGNLLFTSTLTGASEYSPTKSSIIDQKRTVTEELINPSSISIFRPTTQQTIACSNNGMKVIEKSLNSHVNNVVAVQKNNGTITVKVKRSQKPLLSPGNDISHAKITLVNMDDPNIQESFIRYEWDFDGDGVSNYPQSNIDDLLAGLWDFDGDELNDYLPKLNYKISNLSTDNPVFLSPQGTLNSAFRVKVEFIADGAASQSTPFYTVILD